MSQRAGVLLFVAVVVLGNTADADFRSQEAEPAARPPSWVVAGEFGGALVGSAPFGTSVVFSSMISYSEGTGAPGLGMALAVVLTSAGAIVSPFTTAGGTCIAGGVMHQGGRYWTTVEGAAIGTMVALPLAAASILIPPDNAALTGVKFAFAGLSALVPPVGAVISYNDSRPTDGGGRSLGSRLELPQLTMRQECLPDRSELTVYDARLVNVRF